MCQLHERSDATNSKLAYLEDNKESMAKILSKTDLYEYFPTDFDLKQNIDRSVRHIRARPEEEKVYKIQTSKGPLTAVMIRIKGKETLVFTTALVREEK